MKQQMREQTCQRQVSSKGTVLQQLAQTSPGASRPHPDRDMQIYYNARVGAISIILANF